MACLCWVFRRAENFAGGCPVRTRICTAPWGDPQCPLLMLLLIAVVWTYQVVYESRLRPWLARGPVRVGLACGMLIYLGLFSSGGGSFIFFPF